MASGSASITLWHMEEDFAALFEASTRKARQLARGQTIEGTIVGFGAEVAFVDVGGKAEAQIDLDELKDQDGKVEFAAGDRIQARVMSTSGGITLSRRGVRNAATQRELADAFGAGLAVEGKVESIVKGGYEVRIARGPSTGSGSPRAQSRGERAFCPLSQIDIHRTADPAVHVGQTYPFLIIEYTDAGRNVVVSRRKHLEEQQRAGAADIRKAIVPGAVLNGRVTSVLDFGAFVDLGAGVQGLLHVSEMAWTRVASPGEIVAPGDAITVKVLRVDEATQKIALGLKQLQDDPWVAVAANYAVGQVRTGRISRVAEFGVFIELEPGVEGLMPAAETGLDRGADLRKAFPIGSDVEVAILDIDAAGRRIRVSKKGVADIREQAEVREYTSRPDAAPSPSIGSLAENLRNALKGR
jgi:small subunit ribosomal protein S1